MKHDENVIRLLKLYPYYKKLYVNICEELERRKSKLKEPVKLPPDMFNLTIEKFNRPVLRERNRRAAQIKYNGTVSELFGEKIDYNYGYSPMAVIRALTEKREQCQIRIKQIESALDELTDIQRIIIDALVIRKNPSRTVELTAEELNLDRQTIYRHRDAALKRLEFMLSPCLDKIPDLD